MNGPPLITLAKHYEILESVQGRTAELERLLREAVTVLEMRGATGPFMDEARSLLSDPDPPVKEKVGGMGQP